MEPENNTIMNSMVRLQGIQTCGLFLLLLSSASASAKLWEWEEICSRKIVCLAYLSALVSARPFQSPIVLCSGVLERFFLLRSAMEYENNISVPLDEAHQRTKKCWTPEKNGQKQLLRARAMIVNIFGLV
jgi:hypothetical protein